MAGATRRSSRAIGTALVAFVAVAIVAGVIVWTQSDPGSPPSGGGTGGPPRAPLTGLVVDDEASLDHPALAVKISDVRTAHPQVGVDRADIVFVEPIGESYTRFAAVFHSDLPETVGPVRSVRPMDAALIGPMSPVFANTMGAEWILDYVDSAADLDDLGTLRVGGSGAYVRDGRRPSPDDVFVHLPSSSTSPSSPLRRSRTSPMPATTRRVRSRRPGRRGSQPGFRTAPGGRPRGRTTTPPAVT
jgi:hypothetical protein